MTDSGDQHIIQEVLSGNTKAFEKLVFKYQDMVLTLAIRVLSDREDAEEVAQDVFVKVFRSLVGFQQKSNFTTWIYRITYNESVNRLRSKKNKVFTVNLEEGLMAKSHDDHLNPDTGEEKMIIQQALMTLPETERVIITLYYFDDMPVKEIAVITDMSVTNVKTKLFRSRQKLYELLKDTYSNITSLIYSA